MQQDFLSISDAHQCTCHMHKSCPTTMMDSCPHQDIATMKMVDLSHAVWSITYAIYQHITWQEKTRLIWEQNSISPSAGITADAPLSDVGSKCYVALVIYGKFLPQPNMNCLVRNSAWSWDLCGCGCSVSKMMHTDILILSSSCYSVMIWPRPVITALSGVVSCP